MKKESHYLLMFSFFLLASCSGMNTKFSCNLTAGDSCMSMDEVNAITEGKSIHIIRKTLISPRPLIKTRVRRVWIAPYADKNGTKHAGAWVNVPELSNAIHA